MKPLPLFLLFLLPIHLSLAEDAQAARIRRQIESTPMTQKVTLSDDQWRNVLTPGQFQVLREAKTEAPYKNAYWNNHENGIYLCAACGSKLFSSDTKFESRTGWPSFYTPLATDKVTETTDTSHDGTLSPPRSAGSRMAAARFSHRNRAILVRFVISSITPDSCRFEQAFSDDGGKTWEVNWIAIDTRVKDEADKAH
jgi:methionine-R-sulfoxide reductase